MKAVFWLLLLTIGGILLLFSIIIFDSSSDLPSFANAYYRDYFFNCDKYQLPSFKIGPPEMVGGYAPPCIRDYAGNLLPQAIIVAGFMVGGITSIVLSIRIRKSKLAQPVD